MTIPIDKTPVYKRNDLVFVAGRFSQRCVVCKIDHVFQVNDRAISYVAHVQFVLHPLRVNEALWKVPGNNDRQVILDESECRPFDAMELAQIRLRIDRFLQDVTRGGKEQEE